MKDELQVWFENELVGHLRIDGSTYMNRPDLALPLDMDAELSRPSQMIHLAVAHRCTRLPEKDFLIHDDEAIYEMLRARHVPGYAEQITIPHTHETEYRWPIVHLFQYQLGVFEKLFDHPLYVPLDAGPIDREWLEDERRRKARPLHDATAKILGDKITRVWLNELADLEKTPGAFDEADASVGPWKPLSKLDWLGSAKSVSIPASPTLKMESRETLDGTVYRFKADYGFGAFAAPPLLKLPDA